MKKGLLLILFLLISFPCFATTYYAREGGGCPKTSSGTSDPGCAEVCNGQYDVDYSAEVSPNCAYNHPNWAIIMNGQDDTYALSAGDTLVIETGGSFRMGCLDSDIVGLNACRDPKYNVTNPAKCSTLYSYDCGDYGVTSGSGVGSETKVIGCSESGCSDESDYPELWASGRQSAMFDLDNTSNVYFSDLEITDHYGADSECSANEEALCGRNAFNSSNGGWKNITFNKLNIHGLTSRCWLMGGDGAGSDNVNLKIIDTVCRATGSAGFDGDTCINDGTCGFEGDILFQDSEISWSGCEETYPLSATGDNIVDGSCREGNNGGYGDCIAMSDTGGDWVFDNTDVDHCTSDGIDLLYLGRKYRENYGSSSLVVKGGLFEGNNGNSIKAPVGTSVYSIKAIGNCNYFEPSLNSYSASGLVTCRAAGNTLVFSTSRIYDSGTVSVTNGSSTVEGDGTSWSAVVSADDFITVDDVTYKIDSVTDNDTLVLTANYSGTTASGESYYIEFASAESYIYNSTLLSVADVAIQSNVKVNIYNSILRGGRDYRNDSNLFGGGEDQSVDLFYSTNGFGSVGGDYNICYGDFKEVEAEICTDGNNQTADPKFTGTLLQGPHPSPGYYFDSDYAQQVNLASDSPAIGAADETEQTDYTLDYCDIERGDSWDVGAVEYGNSCDGEDSGASGVSCSYSGGLTISNLTLE